MITKNARNLCSLYFFFFNDTATPEIYTLSLHDALPICPSSFARSRSTCLRTAPLQNCSDRKSTRLNSSHEWISYAVFCLKKKNNVDPVSRLPGKLIWLARTGTRAAALPRVEIPFVPSSRRKSRNASSFFFNDTGTTEIYTLSLHDALPI